jgi:hypothetical protein
MKGTIMKHFLLIVALLLPLLSAAAADKPYQLPQLTTCTAVIDGRVDKNEYPASFTEPKSGIQVSWQADSHNIYVALLSPGAGWTAIGFGSDGMNGASMVIGAADAAGKPAVEEHLGKSFYRHAKVDSTRLIASAATLKDGRSVLEFSLPLALSNGKTISPGQPMPFILAFHKDNASLLKKHSSKASAVLLMAAPVPKK